jgi:hypothetical protein
MISDLDLKSTDGCYGVCSSNFIASGLGDTKIFDFSFFLELLQFLPRLLDRNCSVNAMLVIEIDIIHLKILEGFLAPSPDVLRLPRDTCTIVVEKQAKFCANKDLGSEFRIFEESSDEFFVFSLYETMRKSRRYTKTISLPSGVHKST